MTTNNTRVWINRQHDCPFMATQRKMNIIADCANELYVELTATDPTADFPHPNNWLMNQNTYRNMYMQQCLVRMQSLEMNNIILQHIKRK